MIFRQNATQLHKSMGNVQAFGARGDGVTNDTAAILNAINSFNGKPAVSLYFPAGIYKVDRRFVINNAVAIRGAGSGITQIWWASTHPVEQGFQLMKYPVHIDGVTLTTSAKSTQNQGPTAIDINFKGQLTRNPNRRRNPGLPARIIGQREQSRGTINDVVISGHANDRRNAWRNGILMTDVMHFIVSKFNFVGHREHGQMHSANAISVTGEGAPVELHFTDIWAFDCNTGLRIEGNAEGVQVQRGVFVNLNYGIVMRLNNDRPQHHITHTHVNAFHICIHIIGSSSPTVAHCELYHNAEREGKHQDGVGIQLERCSTGYISSNKIALVHSHEAEHFNGIVLSNQTKGMIIEGNTFALGNDSKQDCCIWLQNGSQQNLTNTKTNRIIAGSGKLCLDMGSHNVTYS